MNLGIMRRFPQFNIINPARQQSSIQKIVIVIL